MAGPCLSPYMAHRPVYSRGMTRFAASALIAMLAATPLMAQEQEGPSLIEQGAQLFLKGLIEEMEPALKELEGLAEEMEPMLQDFVTEMGPAMRDLLGKVEDWSLYHPPEMLPNGDIILRRRVPNDNPDDDPNGSDDQMGEGGEIDL